MEDKGFNKMVFTTILKYICCLIGVATIFYILIYFVLGFVM